MFVRTLSLHSAMWTNCFNKLQVWASCYDNLLRPLSHFSCPPRLSENFPTVFFFLKCKLSARKKKLHNLRVEHEKWVYIFHIAKLWKTTTCKRSDKTLFRMWILEIMNSSKLSQMAAAEPLQQSIYYVRLLGQQLHLCGPLAKIPVQLSGNLSSEKCSGEIWILLYYILHQTR